jgi:hypothetical protein
VACVQLTGFLAVQSYAISVECILCAVLLYLWPCFCIFCPAALRIALLFDFASQVWFYFLINFLNFKFDSRFSCPCLIVMFLCTLVCIFQLVLLVSTCLWSLILACFTCQNHGFYINFSSVIFSSVIFRFASGFTCKSHVIYSL